MNSTLAHKTILAHISLFTFLVSFVVGPVHPALADPSSFQMQEVENPLQPVEQPDPSQPVKPQTSDPVSVTKSDSIRWVQGDLSPLGKVQDKSERPVSKKITSSSAPCTVTSGGVVDCPGVRVIPPSEFVPPVEPQTYIFSEMILTSNGGAYCVRDSKNQCTPPESLKFRYERNEDKSWRLVSVDGRQGDPNARPGSIEWQIYETLQRPIPQFMKIPVIGAPFQYKIDIHSSEEPRAEDKTPVQLETPPDLPRMGERESVTTVEPPAGTRWIFVPLLRPSDYRSRYLTLRNALARQEGVGREKIVILGNEWDRVEVGGAGILEYEVNGIHWRPIQKTISFERVDDGYLIQNLSLDPAPADPPAPAAVESVIADYLRVRVEDIQQIRYFRIIRSNNLQIGNDVSRGMDLVLKDGRRFAGAAFGSTMHIDRTTGMPLYEIALIETNLNFPSLWNAVESLQQNFSVGIAEIQGLETTSLAPPPNTANERRLGVYVTTRSKRNFTLIMNGATTNLSLPSFIGFYPPQEGPAWRVIGIEFRVSQISETVLKPKAVQAIADHLEMDLSNINTVKTFDLPDQVFCQGTDCPLWILGWEVTVKDGRAFKGQISQILGDVGDENYRVTLTDSSEQDTLEAKRAKLLAVVDQAIESAKVREEALAEESARLEESFKKAKEAFMSDVESQKNALNEIRSKLEERLPRVTDAELQEAITAFLKETGAYLGEDLSNEITSYLSALEGQMVGRVQMMLQMVRAYLQELAQHRQHVADAKTLEELKALEDEMPQLRFYGYDPWTSPDPRVALKKFIETGKELLKKSEVKPPVTYPTVKEALVKVEGVKDITVYNDTPLRAACPAGIANCQALHAVFYSVGHADGNHYHQILLIQLSDKTWIVSPDIKPEQASAEQAFQAEVFNRLSRLPAFRHLKFRDIALTKIEQRPTGAAEIYNLSFETTQCFGPPGSMAPCRLVKGTGKGSRRKIGEEWHYVSNVQVDKKPVDKVKAEESQKQPVQTARFFAPLAFDTSATGTSFTRSSSLSKSRKRRDRNPSLPESGPSGNSR